MSIRDALNRTFSSTEEFASTLEQEVVAEIESRLSGINERVSIIEQRLSAVEDGLSSLGGQSQSPPPAPSNSPPATPPASSAPAITPSTTPLTSVGVSSTPAVTPSPTSSPELCVESGGILSAAGGQRCCDGLVEVIETRNGFEIIVCSAPTIDDVPPGEIDDSTGTVTQPRGGGSGTRTPQDEENETPE